VGSAGLPRRIFSEENGHQYIDFFDATGSSAASLPMRRIVEPAVAAAREGGALNRLQAYIFRVVELICLAILGERALYASPQESRRLYCEGEAMFRPTIGLPAAAR
jgi:hypothetical protein